MSTTDPLPALKRGGIHRRYGVYLGGSELKDDLTCKSTHLYRQVTQRRHAKSIHSIAAPLLDAATSTTALQFNGNLTISASSSSTAMPHELDQEQFIELLTENVAHHGHQIFTAKNSDKMVSSLLTNHHNCTVEMMFLQHKDTERPHSFS